MKVIAVIPMLILACAGMAALLLKVAGLHVNLMDPVMAAIITSTAAVVGIFPIFRSQQNDAVAAAQTALMGTVLHLFCTVLLSVAVLASNVENLRGPFVFWLLAVYWISLVILVWQLRRILLDASPTPKVQH